MGDGKGKEEKGMDGEKGEGDGRVARNSLMLQISKSASEP